MTALHQIEIRRLRVLARVGVPDEEIAEPQELAVSLTMTLATAFQEMGDDLERTVDYAALAAEIVALAAARPRRLIETLASDVAGHVAAFAAVEAVEVTVEKYILPDTDCVAVRIRRDKRAI
jgi:FolB domain-containing protein